MKSNSFDISYDIDNLLDSWEDLPITSNLKLNYLGGYSKSNPELLHLFVHNKTSRFYFNLFSVNLSKTSNYSTHWTKHLLKIIDLKVLLFSNVFDSTKNYFHIEEKVDINNLLNTIKNKFDVIIIPENLYNLMNNIKQYTRVPVEENMILNINKSWNSIDDYFFSLKKKYRTWFKKNIIKTKPLKVKVLSTEFLEKNITLVQRLFDQVVSNSNFHGPKFNIKTFSKLITENHLIMKGYFYQDSLVGFSTYSVEGTDIYTNYVGYDKKLNLDIPIYSRMLLDHIETAIQTKSLKLILGRTANEFKSNFGAHPEKNFIYIKFNNIFLNILFKPLIRNIKIKKWIQRNPFKKPNQ